MADIAPWERQTGESSQAWEAFQKYRDLGPLRSLAKVASALEKSPALMGRWSRHHSWVRRAEAFDREDDRLWLQEQRQARKDLGRKHLLLANAAQSKIVQRLGTIQPDDLKPADLIRWLEVTAKVQRDASGEAAQQHLTVTQSGGATLAHVPMLTDEDRMSRLIALQREIQTRLNDRQNEAERAEEARQAMQDSA